MDNENTIKCPKCNADIDYLLAFCFEQNKYRVHLQDHDHLVLWSASETVESSETKTEFNCPICEKNLFTTHDGAYPQAVIDFLSGRKNQR